ncbi:MAG: hypothetical protein ACT4NY_00355 [Pseudonocardiales bacterium]
MSGEVLNCLSYATCFYRVSVASHTEYPPKASEPPRHGFGAPFWIQCEDGEECVFSSGEIATQGTSRGEIYPRAEFTGCPTVLFGQLAEQLQGSGGLDFGPLTVA